MTTYKAAKIFQIPRQTLLDKLKNKYTKQKNAGAAPVLTVQQEERIVVWMDALAESGFVISKEQLNFTVAHLVKELGRPNKFKNGQPGRSWFQGFFQRNPTVMPKISQELPVYLNDDDIRTWYYKVYTIVQAHNSLDIFADPSRIFNYNELELMLGAEGQVILTQRDRAMVNYDKNCLITLTLGASAVGRLMPIFALFPCASISESVIEKFPAGWTLKSDFSGSMTCQTFYEYIVNVFDPYLSKENIKRPIVLYLNYKIPHLSLPLIDFCKSNGIILIALPANSSSKLLQPLQLAIYEKLVTTWQQTVSNWSVLNNGAFFKDEEFAPLLAECIQLTLTPEVLQNGFRVSGLYPYAPNAIDYMQQEQKFTKF